MNIISNRHLITIFTVINEFEYIGPIIGLDLVGKHVCFGYIGKTRPTETWCFFA
jgi:hypothetical protein